MSTAFTLAHRKNDPHAAAFAVPRKNVGDAERLLSLAGGAGLAFAGLTQRWPGGLLLAALGGGLLYRGLTGHCTMYSMLGVHTNAPDAEQASIASGQGVHVVHSITINQPAEKLYNFWRDFQNLPRFMKHIDRIEILNETQSRWTVDTALGPVQWQAELITDTPHDTIAWRSLPDGKVACAGSVRFKPLAAGFGTQVDVNLRYDSAAARPGTLIASLFGQSPEQFIREDLRRFKRLMETGEIATIEGQPRGRCR